MNVILPVIVPPAKGSLVPILVAVVVAKFASSPRAAANSFNVSNAAGALSTTFATCASTYVLFVT